MENDELTKVIVHYQQGIEKYSQRSDEAKVVLHIDVVAVAIPYSYLYP